MMRLPTIRGVIRRRLLANFRVDAQVMRRFLCWQHRSDPNSIRGMRSPDLSHSAGANPAAMGAGKTGNRQ